MITNRLLSRICIGLLGTSLVMGTGCIIEDPDQSDDDDQQQVDDPDPVDTDFDCSAIDEISSNISDDTTFSPDNNDCLVFTSTVEVSDGAHLTIEPGVVLQFEAGTGLSVRGTMSAEGTADEPIIMTGTEEQPGFWRGIEYRDTLSSTNTLEHVIIEYGGHDDTFRRASPANLMLNDRRGDPQIAIDNVTLQHGASVGLYADSGARISSFDNNTLTANAGPASVHASHLDMLSDTSSYTGNDQDYVAVRGGTVNDGDHTWSALNAPYGVAENLNVEDNAHVDIDPGAEFRFVENVGLNVQQGTLSANGTADDQILFSGTEEQRGWWRGIQFRNTRSSSNSLDHTIVEYGGASDTFRRASPANLMFNTRRGDPEVAVTNSTFRYSATVGIYVEDGAQIASFENNTLTDNTSGAAAVFTSHLGMIDDSSTYSGNDYDHVLVGGGSISTGDHTWPAIDVSYGVLDNMEVGGDAHVDITGGAEFEFDENVGLNVEEGTLTAHGSDETIEFRALDESLSAYWRGIQYRNTQSTHNRLEGVYIEGAGSSDQFRRAPAEAGLNLNDRSGNVQVSLVDVEIVDFDPGVAVGVDSGVTVNDCSGLTGFGAGDVEGDGSDDFITACGL